MELPGAMFKPVATLPGTGHFIKTTPQVFPVTTVRVTYDGCLSDLGRTCKSLLMADLARLLELLLSHKQADCSSSICACQWKARKSCAGMTGQI